MNHKTRLLYSLHFGQTTHSYPGTKGVPLSLPFSVLQPFFPPFQASTIHCPLATELAKYTRPTINSTTPLEVYTTRVVHLLRQLLLRHGSRKQRLQTPQTLNVPTRRVHEPLPPRTSPIPRRHGTQRPQLFRLRHLRLEIWRRTHRRATQLCQMGNGNRAASMQQIKQPARRRGGHNPRHLDLDGSVDDSQAGLS
ncbi:uncharacterized protein HMPREF1120_04404 [Exophiala dermatitidis NIH/UT8656]|uniref:Uncharacterized protein n=1 Tax=Exophiala dermatitidis (strain ATCC 34100 / CBS 525.76 / NIH/UT8656) TaxID=858893 RepID=H6BZY5_EXODN|nr:uncharacterized protein HMPREF1120_04404 [Exophiala dermatitidis NIH/UT8656]EHY56320.1 hypothetical protein HMPREF1120_04404 [Exophiala dermatitidis NIH/UT8656]